MPDQPDAQPEDDGRAEPVGGAGHGQRGVAPKCGSAGGRPPRGRVAVELELSPGPASVRSEVLETTEPLLDVAVEAAQDLPLTLAVSLHAPDDDLRDTLVPLNTRYPLGEVMGAAHDYFRATGRRVSIEYALIRDVNDQPHRADALAGLLAAGRGTGWVHVNLIPLNPTPGSRWTASTRRAEGEFIRRLERLGIAVTVRDTRGREIDGACGQLAARERG